ncbi:LPS-assembly protein LptD [Enterovirga rhinocerotis]|nr:LPS-assembly protein LptD [Enterovirga rhinocerotis]
MGVRRSTVVAAVALALGSVSLTTLARAQTANDLIARKAGAQSDKSRLLVEGREIVYNRDKNTVAASGDVELNYGGRTLQADRVTLDRTNGRVHATGNVRMIEANGTVTTGDRFELTDDFRTGFIDSLRSVQETRDAQGPVVTRFSAPRGERVDGQTTTFQNGTYTACEPCRDNPERPPLWQVKAARVIHNNEERRIYYENATIEVAGVPIGFWPYFWTPDPSVKRESGFLAPRYIHTKALGYGAAIPYFWAISPDKDLTLYPTFHSRQGFLMQAEYRQRFHTGGLNIRAAGIAQQDEDAFLPGPYGAGDRRWRGSIETTGRFNINENWHYGWDVALLSDKWFLQNYKIRSESFAATNYVLPESTSQAFLRGQGDRSFFDMRAMYFQGLSFADWQKQLPGITPVIDYDKRVNGPDPIGGEVRFQFNFANINRAATQFSSTSIANRAYPYAPPGFQSVLPTAYGTGLYGTAIPYESCAVFQRGACIVNGLAGNFARVSAEASWRRRFIDDAGQTWTPFAYLRADGFFNNFDGDGYQNYAVTNFIRTQGNDFVGRVMPAVGLEYRYPFVADAGRYGVHTVQPIGQIIARPNETGYRRIANEDAHSLVYDDSNLFDWDKFSGYDRAEGGVRANVGIQYNVATPSGWTGSALFGQSYQVAGHNSFGAADLLNTGAGSGLDSRASDFVGRVQVNPSENFSLITRGRFGKDDFSVNGFEAQAVANFKPFFPIAASLTYARYEAQPQQGYLYRREGLRPAVAWDITPNWSIGGSVLFDLDRYLELRDTYATALGGLAAIDKRTERWTVAQTNIGLTYRDECTTLSVNYLTSPRLAATGMRDTDRTVLVRLELRTLGQSNVSQSISTTTADGIATR